MRGEFRVDGWVIQPHSNRVIHRQTKIHVEPKVMEVLVYLIAHAGEVVSKEAVLEAVWRDTFVSDAALWHCISEVRKIFGDDPKNPRVIETIPKKGYRWLVRASSEDHIQIGAWSGGEIADAPPHLTPHVTGSESDSSHRLAGGGDSVDSPPSRSISRAARKLVWSLATISCLGVIATLFLNRDFQDQGPASDVGPMRFAVHPPKGTTFDFTGADAGPATLSPDGLFVVFAAKRDGKNHLWVQPLNSTQAHILEQTEGAAFPFWSPDGRFIGFFAGGKLNKIDLLNQSVHTICDAPLGLGGSWSRREVIIFSPDLYRPLYRVPAAGGHPEPVTALDKSRYEISHRWPDFLPDGDHFVYRALSSERTKNSIFVGSLESGQKHYLTSSLSNAVFGRPGYLLFLVSGSLMFQPIDTDRLELTGSPVSLAESIRSLPGFGRGIFSVSQNGLLAYAQSNSARSQLTWFDRKGTPLGTVGEPNYFERLSLSRDGLWLVVDRRDRATENSDIWLLEVASGSASRLTFDPSVEAFPIWSPDGNRILFSSDRNGVLDLYQEFPKGTRTPVPFLASDLEKRPLDWSGDGRFIIYESTDLDTKSDLWVGPASGKGDPIPFARTQASEYHAQFSPDDRWIAYTSDETSIREVYVQPFPPTGARWQISHNGGSQPRWRQDGGELYYITADSRIVAVEVAKGNHFQALAAKPLFKIDPAWSYATADNGRRFLVNQSLEDPDAGPFTLVVNFTAALK